MKQTQKEFVINELRLNRTIRRNYCLSNYISRLGAIICILNKKGWDIKGKWIETDTGKDYEYRVIMFPEENNGLRVEMPKFDPRFARTELKAISMDWNEK